MAKKFLFISNGNRLSKEKHQSKDKIKISNFEKPSIEATLSLGYEVYVGVNRFYANELKPESDYIIKFYNQNVYRNIFDFKNNFIAYKNLNTLLKSENFDVIHCNTPLGGVFGRLCGNIRKVPKIIYTAHGFHFYKGAPLLNNTLFKWAEMIMANYTDVIITMNKEDHLSAEKFKLRGNGQVYNVPGVGVNTKEFLDETIDRDEIRKSLNLSENDIILISMGDLIARKNYEASIRGIAAAGNSKLHLLICGKGPRLEKLKELSRKLNVENQIHFLGFRTDVIELLNSADIFLFTTLQEGLPRSLMEAMSAGLPCIVSNVRGNIDLINEGNGGLVIEKSDYKAIGNAINTLARDKSMRMRMKQYNLNAIKAYDISNVSKKIKQIYEKELA